MKQNESDNKNDEASAEDADLEIKEKKDIVIILVGILVILLITFGYLLVVRNGADSILPIDSAGAFTKYGTFGDTFGGLNAIFSGLAFLGLIYTILMQRKELSLQRQELRYTRLEMKESVKAQKESAKQQKEQARLIEIQINKDVRPYINAYLDVRDYVVHMVIKNIGKSACHTFKMKTTDKMLYGMDNDEKGNSLERINNYKLSIVPSGLEYAVPIFFIDEYERDKSEDKTTKISVEISFMYNSKQECFSIEYDLSHLNTPFSKKEEKIKQELKEISSSLKLIKDVLKNMKCK